MKIAHTFLGFATALRNYHGAFLLIGLFPENPATAAGMANTGGPVAMFYLGYVAKTFINPEN